MSYAEFPVEDRFYRLLHPRPAFILASKHGERVGVMAASWVQPFSEDPPRIVVAWEKESHTLDVARRAGCFTVNVVGEEMLDALYYVGTRSGWDEPDKHTRAGLVLEGDCPHVRGALGWVEARIHRVIDGLADDVYLVVADVTRVVARSDLYDQRRGWLILRARIPLQVAGRTFGIIGRIVRAGGKAGRGLG